MSWFNWGRDWKDLKRQPVVVEPRYVIDWDKINNFKDLKRLLKVLTLSPSFTMKDNNVSSMLFFIGPLPEPSAQNEPIIDLLKLDVK